MRVSHSGSSILRSTTARSGGTARKRMTASRLLLGILAASTVSTGCSPGRLHRDIGEVRQAGQWGDTVIVRGVVTAGPGFGRRATVIQDETGAMWLGESLWGQGVEIDDLIEVSGMIYAPGFELSLAYVEVRHHVRAEPPDSNSDDSGISAFGIAMWFLLFVLAPLLLFLEGVVTLVRRQAVVWSLAQEGDGWHIEGASWTRTDTYSGRRIHGDEAAETGFHWMLGGLLGLTPGIISVVMYLLGWG